MSIPYRNNCFQLFGFDLMIDDKLNVWLLEVNLSPSLCCDSPLDLKVKGKMVSDLLNLTGIVSYEHQTTTSNPTGDSIPLTKFSVGDNQFDSYSSVSNSMQFLNYNKSILTAINGDKSKKKKKISNHYGFEESEMGPAINVLSEKRGSTSHSHMRQI